jgi:signal transduction histidine kinase
MSTLSEQMSTNRDLTQRERELGAIIDAYNQVTEQLKQSHEKLGTEVVRLREELAKKNRQLRRRERLAALGEMAAGVAHEIRNPLGGIQLFASLLEKDLRDRPAQHRLAGKIAKGVGSVEAIVTDFLEFGRPRDPQPGPVRLGVVAREAVELAAKRAEEAHAQVEVAEALAEIEIVSDAVMIKRAVLNLVLNAIDAAREGVRQREAACGDKGHAPQQKDVARVMVSARTLSPDNIAVTVSDNGPGVPPDLMDRIFNPFFTTKDRGMGLGLAIVHQLVESLNGNVQVANAAEGGAVFSLCLPVVFTPAEEAE